MTQTTERKTNIKESSEFEVKLLQKIREYRNYKSAEGKKQFITIIIKFGESCLDAMFTLERKDLKKGIGKKGNYYYYVMTESEINDYECNRTASADMFNFVTGVISAHKQNKLALSVILF